MYCSPYTRTHQTLAGLLDGADLSDSPPRIFEDPRLREMEYGYGDVDAQQEQRRTHGWFYYRLNGGESPANVYDRCSSFLEGLMRQMERKDNKQAVIVAHGTVIRCFVMRFLHLSVEDYERMANISNCGVVRIAAKETIPEGERSFSGSRWAVSGLSFYPDD